MPPTDAPRCGNCKWWTPDCRFDEVKDWTGGDCQYPLPAAWEKLRVMMESTLASDGYRCPCHTPKDPAK